MITDTKKTIDHAVRTVIDQEIVLPLVLKHGTEKGHEIICAVKRVTDIMNSWPDEIKNECKQALLLIIDVADRYSIEY